MVALSKRIERDKDNGAMIIQRETATTRICSAQNYKVPPSLTNNNMSGAEKSFQRTSRERDERSAICTRSEEDPRPIIHLLSSLAGAQ